MKIRHSHFVITFMLLFPVLTLALGKADFSGGWVMDKSKSSGLPENMEQKMRVTQQGDKLDLETDLFLGDDVNTVHDGYVLNGQEVEFQARLNTGQQTQGKRTAKWNEDGKGFEVNESASFDTPEGKVTITMRRKWALSEDGKTLVIELNHTGPNEPVSSKRTFNRKGN